MRAIAEEKLCSTGIFGSPRKRDEREEEIPRTPMEIVELIEAGRNTDGYNRIDRIVTAYVETGQVSIHPQTRIDEANLHKYYEGGRIGNALRDNALDKRSCRYAIFPPMM